MSINRIAFFNRLKTYNLYQKLNQNHVDSFNAILDYWEASGYSDLRWLSYILATIYHETARTMMPIEEYGKGAGRPYGKKLRQNGKPYDVPDKIFYGRGEIQTTWLDNYEKLTQTDKAISEGWDFVNHPELLLQMKPSIWAAFYGMTKGIYTGKKLSDFFNDKTDDALHARKIINGMDKASLIESYYNSFLKSLK